MDTRVVSEAFSKTLLYWFYSFGITHKKIGDVWCFVVVGFVLF